MSYFDEAVNALQGCWLLARRDTAGYGGFNMTVDGFWRSFGAIVLVSPIYLAVSSLGPTAPADAPDSEPTLAVRTVVLLVQWFAYPAAMVLVTRMLDLQHRYVPYVIAYNWSSVLAVAVMAPPFVLAGTEAFSPEATFILFMVLMAAVIYYRWFIASTALETNAVTAAAIVAFDLVFSIVVGLGIQRLLGG